MEKTRLYKETLYNVEDRILEARRIILKALLQEGLSPKERDELTATATEICDIAHKIIERRANRE